MATEEDGFHEPTREADPTELRALRMRANRPTNELLSKRAPTSLIPLPTMPALRAPVYPMYRGGSNAWLWAVGAAIALTSAAAAFLLV